MKRAATPGFYTANREILFQLENGYYLLYYHRQKFFTVFMLYLRFIIPLVGLAYLLKKNPFYKVFPAALPIMIFLFGILLYRTTKYGTITNRMVHQILLDPTGTELTFIYKNRAIRRFRNDVLEDRVPIASLQNPPQGPEYVPLQGQLFPQKFPFDYHDQYDLKYFWLKYYLTQYNFFSIPKKPIYANYEVLVNSFNQENIDFSEAKIYQLQNSAMKRNQLEEVLFKSNQYTREKFALRARRLNEMKKAVADEEKTQREEKERAERLKKSFDIPGKKSN